MLSRLFRMGLLLVSSICLAMAQNCPNGKTVFIWINGVLEPSSANWHSQVLAYENKFGAAHPDLDLNCVKFATSYNSSVNGYKDFLQGVEQMAAQDVDQYLNNLDLISQSKQAHQSFMAAALGYQNDLKSADPDMAVLDGGAVTTCPPITPTATCGVLDWWKNGYRVVLVGYSQGNFYANAEYNLRLRNADGQGKQLPDSNQLSVIGIATPADKVADGRQQYTTHCNDPIHFAYPPKALGANIGSPTSCFVLQAVDAGLYLTGNWFNALAATLIGNGYIIDQHFIDTYMTDGSDTQKQIYQQLEDALPDPGCSGDTNCYLNDKFISTDYTPNWRLTDYTALGTKIQQGNGELGMYVSQLTSDRAFGGGSLTLRTRRVFSGPFIGNLQFKHITNLLTPTGAGWGTSVISLKRASDDRTAISLTLTNDTGTPTNEPWHQISIVKTDTQMSMAVDNQTWAGQSASIVSVNPTDGYYIEVKTTGNDNLLISNLFVASTRSVATPPPITVTSSVVISPAGASYAGQSIAGDFTIQNTSAEIITLSQLVLGGRFNQQNPCQGSCPDIGPAVTNLTLVPGQTYSYHGSIELPAAGHYDWFVAYLKAGSPSWVTTVPAASGVANSKSLDVSAPRTFTLTPATAALTVIQSQSVYADLILKSRNGLTGYPTVGLFCYVSCPANFAYNYPSGSATNLPANGSIPIRVTFNTTSATALGNYSFGYWATMGTLTLVTNITVTVTAPPLNTPTIVLTPVANALSVAAGQSVSADLVLKSQGGLTGYPTVGLFCYVSCPANFAYSYPSGSATNLPSNGSIPIRVTFSPTASAAPGTYNFGYQASLSGVTTIVQIAVTVTAPTAVTGSVNVSATKSGSAFTGALSCTLTKPSGTASITSLPYTLSSAATGTYSLGCMAPSGYAISSITPAATQSLSTGGNVNFAVNLTPVAATGTIKVLATMNGQSYTGAMACGFLNSPSNIQVNSVPFTQSNLSLGTYNLNCAGGPPNSQLQSFSPSASQTLTAGGVITYTAVYVWATVTVYSNPLPTPSGSWTWNLSAWQSSGSSWVIQPVLTVAGVNYSYSHPEQYILALQQIQNWGATGPLGQVISQLQAVLPYWPPYVIVSLGPSAPTVSGYSWNNTPHSNVLFSGNLTGTGFVSGGSAVYFCVTGTATCYQHPAVGVAVNSSISLSVYNVNLTTGSWQAKVVTPYGIGIGPAFSVQ
jgi:hypothetical protein